MSPPSKWHHWKGKKVSDAELLTTPFTPFFSFTRETFLNAQHPNKISQGEFLRDKKKVGTTFNWAKSVMFFARFKIYDLLPDLGQ